MAEERDYRTTGSRQPTSEGLRPISGWTPTPQPRHSGTTGSQSPAQRAERPTGPRHGETGAVATQSDASPPAPLGHWVKEKLGGFNLPEETMRSMSSSLTSHVAPTTSSAWGADGQFDGTKLGPFGIKPGWNRAEMLGDLARVAEVCKGGKRAEIAHEVAKLMVRTKSRAHGEGESRLMAETMVADLGAYPIDVVRFACEYWVDGGADAKFTPSWPELKEICDKRMDGRLRLKRALEHVLAVQP